MAMPNYEKLARDAGWCLAESPQADGTMFYLAHDFGSHPTAQTWQELCEIEGLIEAREGPSIGRSEHDAGSRKPALGELNVELLEAAEEVIRVWEKGDLAVAVRDMAQIVEKIRILEEEAAT